jgi:dTDP-6-deoxy-L-talose 4-dehydrogenase (NAD+)
MKTLVTGANGFIGQHLLQQNLGGEIHVLTRQSLNLQDSKIIQHRADLRDLSSLREISSLNFDRLIHLAWSGLPSLTQENNRLNLKLSKDLIDVFIDSGIKEINMVGSCLEYGNLDSFVSEKDTGVNLSDFGESKLQLLDYLSSKNPNFRWMRIFYAYGPHQHANSLLRQGYTYAKSGKTIQLNDGKQSKDFIYVDDVALGIALLLEKGSQYGIYNLGSGISTSVSQMIALVNKEMGLPDVGFESGIDSLRADTRKIRDACGWVPSTDISDGVSMSVQWMIKNNV